MTAIRWATTKEELEAVQDELGHLRPRPWHPEPDRPLAVAGVFVASATGLSGAGAIGDPLWAAAVLLRVDPGARGPISLGEVLVRGEAGGPYLRGYLACRVGPLLERALVEFDREPDVVLVNATGLDHPRRAGLALHLGAVLGRPTVGVTDRPLLATIAGPRSEPSEEGAWTPLVMGEEVVGAAVRTRGGARTVFVHAGWRTDPDVAREVVLRVGGGRARTPEPLRRARRLARQARARDEGRAPGTSHSLGRSSLSEPESRRP